MTRVVTWLALAWLASCGYRTGMVLPETQDAVAIEFFGNESKERDVEMELHASLTDAMNRMVAAELVTLDRADLVLRGTMEEYARRGGIRSPDNELLETGVRIGVEARLVRIIREQDGSKREEEVARGVFR